MISVYQNLLEEYTVFRKFAKHKQIKQYQINAINMCLVAVCVHVFKSIKTIKLPQFTVTDSDQTLV